MSEDAAVTGDPGGVSLEEHAARAAGGDAQSLAAVCRGVQDLVFRLALRFFSEPADAEDATQEILVRVITSVGQFDGRARFTTWVYTIAVRYLARARRSAVEDSVRGADAFAAWLDAQRGLEPAVEDEVAFRELCGEVRISCTYGMLACLSRDQRLAYLLGDVIGVTDTEAAALGVTAPAYRKRLQRARATMREIMSNRCGLIRQANPCRCSQLVRPSERAGILDPADPTWARLDRDDGSQAVAQPIPAGVLAQAAEQLDDLQAIASVFRHDPAWIAPRQIMTRLRAAAPALVG